MNLLAEKEYWQQLLNTKCLHSDPAAHEHLTKRLKLLFDVIPIHQPILFLCVGTDRSTGDALGPLVGSSLHRRSHPEIKIFGTLDEPVHALNLKETVEQIQRLYHNPFIIAIDACLGQADHVGSIRIGLGPVRPGAGVKKELPPVGHIHITGVVNIGGFLEYYVLQNTRLSLVFSMAEMIANAIFVSLTESKRISFTPFS